jgi:hypothetical protein
VKREDRRRRSRALVPRYYKFESISLQRGVTCEPEFSQDRSSRPKAGRLGFFGELEGLRGREAFAAHLAPLKKKKWFVYAKSPFAGPEAVERSCAPDFWSC